MVAPSVPVLRSRPSSGGSAPSTPCTPGISGRTRAPAAPSQASRTAVEGLQCLSHSAVSCLWVRMGSLHYAVGQTLRYPELPRRSVHLVLYRCWGDSLEDEPVLDPKIRKLRGLETQQLRWVQGNLLHASRERVCHHVLAALPMLDAEVEPLKLQRPPSQAS
ncbi:hypothetical protein KR032_003595 [Drosophila birchii]|nr:hypothetical protein KR032_003595 [Drosophila birchii]